MYLKNPKNEFSSTNAIIILQDLLQSKSAKRSGK